MVDIIEYKTLIDLREKSIFKDIVYLISLNLGQGYLSIKDIDKYLNKYSFVAINKNNVIGVVLSYIAGENEVVDTIALKNKTGVLKTIAVSDSWKGRGVGSSLVALSEKEMFSLVSDVMVPAWGYGDNVNIKNLLISFNYKYSKRVKGLWEKDCLNNCFSCPIKEENICSCFADIYIKKN